MSVAGKARLLGVLRPADGGLLWRTAKADVEGEISLPPQSHRTTCLTLNAIERHFYMEQHKVWATPATLHIVALIALSPLRWNAAGGSNSLNAQAEPSAAIPGKACRNHTQGAITQKNCGQHFSVCAAKNASGSAREEYLQKGHSSVS